MDSRSSQDCPRDTERLRELTETGEAPRTGLERRVEPQRETPSRELLPERERCGDGEEGRGTPEVDEDEE